MRPTLIMIALFAMTGCIIVRDGRSDRTTQHPAVGESSCSPGEPGCSEDPPCEEEEGGLIADCDGHADIRFDFFDAPERTVPLTWSWEPDLRTLGGLLRMPTGALVAQDLYFDEPFGGRVVLKQRSDYGPALDAELGVRLEGQLDVFVRSQHLEIWSPDHREGTLHWESAYPPVFSVDATFGTEGLWVAGCDGETVFAENIDLLTDSASVRHQLDRPATACSVLGPGRDDRPVLITSGLDTPLERWALDPIDGFADRLLLADRASPERVRTSSLDGQAAFAFTQQGRLYIFDRDGDGDIVGQGVSSRFDIAIAPDGAVLATWADTEDRLFLALGHLPDPLTVFDLGLARGV